MPKAEVRMLNGYRLIYEPEYHRAMSDDNWKGYVYEHIVVAENSLGRRLTEDEVVHHLDFNRANNRSENLLVLLHGQHSKLHAWLASGAPMVQTIGGNGVNSGKSNVTEPTYCLGCKRTLQALQDRYCSVDCSANGQRKAERPTANVLKAEIETMSFLAIGRKYGVSDNSVRKWARAYGLL